eukprot:TRINITY_DN47_c0_g1_i3.p2 TRINITY_DN47_c0_g1~~TRINITY_DN47_c0_g1_i3.p2  ORF type:complete len:431 (-),score=225.07 TRINITY_DN47_c0_g1_i3:131-1351(-)
MCIRDRYMGNIIQTKKNTKMRAIAALFLASLVVFASADLRKNKKVAVPTTEFTQLDQHHFGNTLLSTIAIHMATGAPLEEIEVLLANVRQDLIDQQDEADNTNEENRANCNDLLEQFDNLRNYHNAERENNEGILEDNQNSLEIANEDLDNTNNAIDNNQRRIDEGQETRDVRHQEFENLNQEYEDSIEVVDEAISLVRHLRAGSSFIQLKGRFQKVQGKFAEHVKKSKHAHLYTPIISALTQLASKADQETVRRILDLLADLRDALVNSKAADGAVEDQEQEDWENLLDDLENERETLNAKRSALQSAIDTFQNIIEESSQNIEYHQVQYENANDNWDSENEYCDGLYEAYEEETASREQALDIITRLNEHFEAKIAGLKEYLINRVDTDFQTGFSLMWTNVRDE